MTFNSRCAIGAPPHEVDRPRFFGFAASDGGQSLFVRSGRVQTVRGAAELALKEWLSINFLPNAVYRPAACIRSTFEAAQRYQFPIERIIFDVTEGDRALGRVG